MSNEEFQELTLDLPARLIEQIRYRASEKEQSVDCYISELITTEMNRLAEPVKPLEEFTLNLPARLTDQVSYRAWQNKKSISYYISKLVACDLMSGSSNMSFESLCLMEKDIIAGRDMRPLPPVKD